MVTVKNKQVVPATMSMFDNYDLISKSDLFDVRFYLDKYRDVADLGLDPVLHYLETGAREGREPHARFDTAFYLGQCAERGIKTESPLLHYLMEGQALGLRPGRSEPATGGEVDGQHKWMIELVLASGLFDRQFYNRQYGTQFENDREGLRHFYFTGYKEGRKPNLYFDPTWYLNTCPDVRDAGAQPLFHFCASGDSEGRQPSRIFDAIWYREAYGIPAAENTLAHFMANRTTCRFSPLPEFDVEYYATNNKDVRDAKIDPFEHFLLTGYREGRTPSSHFNIRYYVKRYLGGNLTSNPFLHFLEHKHEPGIFGAPPENEATISRAVRRFCKPAAEFEEFSPILDSAPKRAKVLAYYLPQFHSFPENDEWWGKGFTEWTNIARGVARFDGHYQPRIPRDLGFYTLDSVSVLKRQVELAKGGGIFGFVFYHYWFNGKRLMEKPIELFLSNASVDIPFCLMWANENWTRRWDGDEHEILISQDYEPDDDVKLIADFVRHFKDSRYIRIDGRPLLMIYRPGIIPDCGRTISRWRRVFKDAFNEDPILVMAQAFNDFDPSAFGFDGAIEFPPHKLTANMPLINDGLEYIDVEFTGKVFSYDDVVARSLGETPPPFPLIKTAVPGWDNDARRQGTGLVIHGSTPAKYETWLGQLIKRADERPFFGERIVCINAWNEWCEAAYLEPDLHYGSAYLNATGRAVAGLAALSGEYKVLLVGHDAFPSGSQHLLLNIARHLSSYSGVRSEFLLLSGGKLEKSYRDVAPVSIASDQQSLAEQLDELKRRGFVHVIVNTTAASHILPQLCDRGLESVCLVHELPGIIREKRLTMGARAALELGRHVVFASEVVRDQVANEVGVAVDQRMLVLPQGMYREFVWNAHGAASIRKELGLRAREKLVVGVGYADLRKGFDLFLQLWRQVSHSGETRVHFCWVGDIDLTLRDGLATEIIEGKASGTFHMPGYRSDVDNFLMASSAFVLTSREDPFPTVIHEALGAGLPVFVFDGTGGMPDFLRKHQMGVVVAHGDVIGMAEALRKELGKKRDDGAIHKRKEFVRAELDFGKYVGKLLRLVLPTVRGVSVAIPNYNYARYMPERLGSVFQQTYPVEEIIVLDDCSTDDSLTVITRVVEEWKRKVTLLPNARNSGSVFKQWRKAAEAGSGEFLWIAEADDRSDPAFLATLVSAMQVDPRIQLGFSDSRSITVDGSPLWASYKDYFAEQDPGALRETQVFDGPEFVRRHLAIRNLILNVSAVVWRREALCQALEACDQELQGFRMAGDWRLYLEILSEPTARIAYIAEPLNVHRRHAESVTHALKADAHIGEIARCHQLAVRKLKLPTRILVEQSKYLALLRIQLLAEPHNVDASEDLRKGNRSKSKAG